MVLDVAKNHCVVLEVLEICSTSKKDHQHHSREEVGIPKGLMTGVLPGKRVVAQEAVNPIGSQDPAKLTS